MASYTYYDETLKAWTDVSSSHPLPTSGGGGGGGTTDVSALNKESTQLTLATQATLAAVLAKLSADPATQTTLAALVTQVQDITATGNITALNANLTGTATAGSAVELTVNGRDTASIQITGTYVGTLVVQGTVDGTNWLTITGAQALSNVITQAYAASVPANGVGIYQLGIGSLTKVRITASAYTSGTAVITVRAVDGNAYVALDSALPAGAAAIGTVALNAALPAGGNTIGAVIPGPPSAFTLTTAATTNATLVAASAKSLYEISVTNPTASTVYLRMFNKASAPTVGTDTPLLAVAVAAGATYTAEFGPVGKRFVTGLSYAVTGGATLLDSTAAAAGAVVSGSYL